VLLQQVGGLAVAGTVYNNLGEAMERMVRIERTFDPNAKGRPINDLPV